MNIPFGLAGMTAGFGLASKAFDSPGLGDAGVVSGNFISTAINISVGGSLIKQIKNFRNK